jgi:hypothetical protein
MLESWRGVEETAMVAATLALVVVLIIALDWPFRGEISINPTYSS